jgi:hypothetical protein
LLTQRKMSVTGGALYVSKLTTNNSKLACIAIWLDSAATYIFFKLIRN